MPRKPLPDHLRRPIGRPPKYPWDRWLDGQLHLIREQQDFDCSRDSMRQQIYIRARRDGQKVSVTYVDRDALHVQVAPEAQLAGARRKHDWDLLLDGKQHQLKVGTDVKGSVQNFRSYASSIAKDRNKFVSVQAAGGFIFIQARWRPGFEPAPPTPEQRLESRDPFGVL